jgi:hypothetical protein
MRIGTNVTLYTRSEAQEQRALGSLNRTRVTLIEKGPDSKLAIFQFSTLESLRYRLEIPTATADPQSPVSKPNLQLFFVEDLSRELIESIGSRFNLDPSFFRSHIGDDSGKSKTARLATTHLQRSWFQIHNIRLRIGRSKMYGPMGFDNIQRDRRMLQQRTMESKGTVSVSDTQTTIWIGTDQSRPETTIGIVLVDPDRLRGASDVYDRDSWHSVPEVDDSAPAFDITQLDPWLRDLVSVTLRHLCSIAPGFTSPVDPVMLSCPIALTICAEWLNICEFSNRFLSTIEASLDQERLWRTICKESNILEVLEHVRGTSRESNILGALEPLRGWPEELRLWKVMVTDTVRLALPTAARLGSNQSSPESKRLLKETEFEFEQIATAIGELQERVNQILDRGTSEMQLIAARQSLAESHDLARLTWLATIFVPMTFVSGLFSMNDNIGSLVDSFKTFFAVAIPIAVLALVIARFGSTLMRCVRKPYDLVLAFVVHRFPDQLESKFRDRSISDRRPRLHDSRRIRRRI